MVTTTVRFGAEQKVRETNQAKNNYEILSADFSSPLPPPENHKPREWMVVTISAYKGDPCLVDRPHEKCRSMSEREVECYVKT